MESSTSCKHLNKLVGTFDDSIFHKKEKWSCVDCNCEGPNLWMCLEPDCYHVGCSENYYDHSTLHQKELPSHCLHINISTERIWCYQCSKEVHLRVAKKMQKRDEGISIGGSSLSHLGLDKSIGLNVSPGDSEDEDDDYSRSTDDETDRRGLVGLQNMGNTCYMNAALQALSNTLPLTSYFLECGPALSVIVGDNNKAALTRAYHKLVKEMWSKKTKGCVVPNGILYGIRNVHPMFRGYHQHDTQEFLRCFMDQLHEELKEPVTYPEDNNKECDGEGDSLPPSTSRKRAISVGDATYFSRLRRKSPASASLNETTTEGYQRLNDVRRHNRTQSYSHSPRGCDLSDSDMSCESEAEVDNDQYETCSSSSEPLSQHTNESVPGESGDCGIKYRSIISDVFDGKLLSSVQCLVCDRVSTRVETFQDLSLPIPSREHIALLRSQHEIAPDSWLWWLVSWVKSWLYGPIVSLQDCLAAFFSADELKGDNMYSCSRCNKLRNGIKLSGIIKLPEVLSVHLKRFRHELMFSCKLGAKVAFPLQDLEMKPYLHKDCVSRVSRYELAGVIVHAGTAGGGHYTCVARSPASRKWYHFDDHAVTPLDVDTVSRQEAYVLFYRKVNPQMWRHRRRAAEILSSVEEQSDGDYYISRRWITRFNTWAEPGPVDNSDFCCQHGAVRPERAAGLRLLAVSIPTALWLYLTHTFGVMHPSCTSVNTCLICARHNRRKHERSMFLALHAKQEEENPRLLYAVNMSWFKQWQSYVKSNHKPPSAIDNKSIAIKQESLDPTQATYTLKHNSDCVQFSEEIWQFFHNLYGGGPEIKLKVYDEQSGSDTEDCYNKFVKDINRVTNDRQSTQQNGLDFDTKFVKYKMRTATLEQNGDYSDSERMLIESDTSSQHLVNGFDSDSMKKDDLDINLERISLKSKLSPLSNMKVKKRRSSLRSESADRRTVK